MWELMNDPSLIDSWFDLFQFLFAVAVVVVGMLSMIVLMSLPLLLGFVWIFDWFIDGGLMKDVLPWLRKERTRARREEALAQEFSDSRSEQ